nr:hypothetical protein OG296_35965 [Streptomyces sp. NBC_01001]
MTAAPDAPGGVRPGKACRTDAHAARREHLPARRELRPQRPLAVSAVSAVAGYLDKGGSRFDTAYAGVNGASTPTADTAGVLAIDNDSALITTYLQESC